MKNKLKSTAVGEVAHQDASSNRAFWRLLAVAGLTLISSLLLFILSAQNAYEPEAEGARLAILGEETIDYGDVKLGSTIETVVKVKNIGDQVLVFSENPYVELIEGC